jgi:uncharacterized protein (TIGR00296 family)
VAVPMADYSRPAAFAYSAEEGDLAVRAARSVVEAAASGDARDPKLSLPESFDRKAGIFTTLSTHPGGKLRGCVGFAEPVMALRQALATSARAAAVEDGRFEPVTKAELAGLVVEVSLLTPPRAIEAARPEHRVESVVVGKHGLIIRRGRSGGLLLPQVATDWDWSPEEFLEHTCEKGGFEPDFWKRSEATVLAFEAEIFGEESPRGAVRRHVP